MIQQKNRKGVSPVIGVILMVAITVIIAAVVANFVLGLAGNLEEDPDATYRFDQSVDSFGSSTYEVNVSVSQMDNADYLAVTTQDDSGITTDSNYAQGTAPNPDNAPDSSSPSNAASIANNGVILYDQGDEASLGSLSGDATVQVYGALDGSEVLLQEYEVEDTLN